MPVINRADLATTGIDEDAITTSSEGEVIHNLGQITTTGIDGDGMTGFGDRIQIYNWGSIEAYGDGGSGFYVFGDDAILKNFGSVATYGSDLNGSVPVGVAVVGDRYRIENHGSIATSGDFGWGMAAFGDSGTIQNFGVITTSGFGADGILAVGVDNQVVNHGTIDIQGEQDIFAGYLAAGIDSAGNGAKVENRGTILFGGFAYHGIRVVGDSTTVINSGLIEISDDFNDGILVAGEGIFVSNSGTIRGLETAFYTVGLMVEAFDGYAVNSGLISLANGFATGVHLSGANSVFENLGVIELPNAGVGVQISAEQSQVVNRGSIVANGPESFAILSGDFDDHVTNHGGIVGNVDLTGGNDVYVAGVGGSFDGLLFLGEGDDLLVVERNSGETIVADFEAGAGSDDVMDLSAFLITDLDDLLAIAEQVGSDVAIAFGVDTSIVLQNVALGELHGDDFLFAAAAAGVAGGMMSLA